MPTSLIVRARRPAIALAAAALMLGGLAPAALAADAFAVTTPYPSISVAPGSNASFDLTVTTPVAGTVDLSVAGAPSGWKATLHGGGLVINSVTASPGKAATARLDVTVPGDTKETKASMRIDATLGSQHTTLPITPWEAALGGTAQLDTLDGPVTVRIPPASPAGRKIRLRGYGYPQAKGGKGDLYAELDVVVPTQLSPRERELFEELAKVSTFNPRQKG